MKEINSKLINSEATIVSSRLDRDVVIYKGAIVKSSQLNCNVSIGNDTIVEKSKISSNTMLNRRNYILSSEIGDYCYTGIGTMILSSIIGKFCSISWNVSIGGADHEHQNISTFPKWRFELMDTGKFNNSDTYNNLPCLLGNDVLVSTGAIVLRNVKIGDGAIIGAGAIVTKDVEPYSIVAGVPARKIKMRFDEETVKVLLEIKWWDWPIEIIRQNQELLFSTKMEENFIEKIKQIALIIKNNG